MLLFFRCFHEEGETISLNTWESFTENGIIVDFFSQKTFSSPKLSGIYSHYKFLYSKKVFEKLPMFYLKVLWDVPHHKIAQQDMVYIGFHRIVLVHYCMFLLGSSSSPIQCQQGSSILQGRSHFGLRWHSRILLDMGSIQWHGCGYSKEKSCYNECHFQNKSWYQPCY